MPYPRTILVCTDFSDASDVALREALGWSARLRATVHILHVVEPPVGAADVDLDISAEGALHSRAVAAIEAALARTQVDGSLLGARCVRLGVPQDVVLRVARELEVGLIVLGTHGHSSVRRFLLGGLAERVAHDADRPVLLSRAPGAGRTRAHEPSLLASLDLQPASSETWSYAVDLAEGLGLEAHALHVYTPVLISPADCAELSPLDEVHQSALRELERVVDRARSPVLGKCIAAAGDPRWIVPETAEQLGSELVVVGRNPPSLSKLAFGDVHAPVLARAPCSVLVVNHPPSPAREQKLKTSPASPP